MVNIIPLFTGFFFTSKRWLFRISEPSTVLSIAWLEGSFLKTLVSCVFHPTGFSGECPRSELLHYLGRFLFLPGAREGWKGWNWWFEHECHGWYNTTWYDIIYDAIWYEMHIRLCMGHLCTSYIHIDRSYTYRWLTMIPIFVWFVQ